MSSGKRDSAQKWKKVAVFSFVLFLLFSFLACENPVGMRINDAPLRRGEGSFSLTFTQGRTGRTGRTILPATPSQNDFAVYNLVFLPVSGGAIKSVDRDNDTLEEPVYLTPGIYNLVVYAYKDYNKSQLVARGTLDGIEINAGQNSIGSVILQALLTEGSGTFRWDITVPANVTSAAMKITPANQGGTAEQTVALSPGKNTGGRTLNSGQYNITINLESPKGTVAWKELLYVYQNLESMLTVEFSDAYFTNYTVTYESNSGSNVGEQSVLHGGAVTAPGIPSKYGYDFGGWYTDNNTFANAWNFNTAVFADMTLYAKWLEVAGITITRLPTKTYYITGQQLDISGMVVTATYTDGTTGTVMVSAAAIDGFDSSAEGDITLTVNYMGFSDTFTVSIVEATDLTVTNTAEWYEVRELIAGGGGNRAYAITISGDVAVEGDTVQTFGTENVTVMLYGSGRLYLTSRGSMINIVNNQTLIIDSADLTLQGLTNGQNGATQNNDEPLVYVEGTNAKLELRDGTICDNASTSASSYGGGVWIYNATFTMSGGIISGNSAYRGGGVAVQSARAITMSGGTISNNTAGSSSGSTSYGGGGVYVSRLPPSYLGTLVMNGGAISGNTANRGGGVYVTYGAFRIVNGIVYGADIGASSNTAQDDGATLYNSNGTAQRGTFSGSEWDSMGDLGITGDTIWVVEGELVGIGKIATPIWFAGDAVSLTAPDVRVPIGQTVDMQGWQTSADGSNGWTEYTSATAALSDSGNGYGTRDL